MPVKKKETKTVKVAKDVHTKVVKHADITGMKIGKIYELGALHIVGKFKRRGKNG